MKGFKKDGKFRPIGKRTKSTLKKSDVRRKRNDAFNGQSGAGVPKPQQVMPPTSSPNWRTGGQSQSQSTGSQSQSTGSQSQSPLGSLGSIPMPQGAKGKPVLPIPPKDQQGLLSKIGKGGLNLLKGEAERQNKLNKKRDEVKHDQEQIQDIINSSIDQILDDTKSTNEHKFRLLQRYAIDNRPALSEYQLNFINTSLKTLERETTTPSTFIGALQPLQKGATDSKRKTKSKSSTGTTSTGTISNVTATPTISSTGQIHGVSKDPLGGFKPTTTSENGADNLGAELSAVIGG